MAELSGGCHCGAVRYRISMAPRRHSLCHCRSCRLSAGAFLVGWAVFPAAALHVTGTLSAYNSSGDVQREFCPSCGTGLFFRSATQFPGEVDVRTATLDETERLAPTEMIQTTEAPGWMEDLAFLPRHARFPPE